MDDNSEIETIVDESLDNYDSLPSSRGFSNEVTNPDSDSSCCQSEKSLSIFTSRKAEKRILPVIIPPNSPVFAQAPSTKVPRFLESIDSHLGMQSSNSGFPSDQAHQTADEISSKPPHKSSQTQSNSTTCPSQQDVTRDMKHPPITDSHQTLATPTSPTSRSTSLVSNYTHPDPTQQYNLETQTPKNKTPNDSLDMSSHAEKLPDCGSQDDSVMEIEKIQLQIRLRLNQNSRDKDMKHADHIKKSLQDMQVRLRHLGKRQREQRYQLSTTLKQQATSSNSSSESQQQQEVKSQLQHMAKRQQQLLKLLQSHKELAAALQSQYAEHRDRQHPQTPARTSNPSEGNSQDIECNDSMQVTSGDNVSADKSLLPTKAALSNLSHHQEIRVTTRSSSSETNIQPVSLPQKIILTRSQDSYKTQPLSKPATDTRSFKPPFKAKQATRPLAVDFIPTITLADDSSSNPNIGLSSVTVVQESKSTASHIVKGLPPVTKESGINVPQSPPFSPSSDISNDEFLSEMTGVLVKKGKLDVLGGQEQNECHQEATYMQTVIIPHPYPNLSAINSRQNDAVNHGITDQPKQVSNVSPILVHNTNHAIRTLDVGTISNSHVCVSSDQVKPQNISLQSGCQPLGHQRMLQPQSINPSSSTGQGIVATSRSTLASSQPKKVIIISANGSDNIRVLAVSTKSTTALGIGSTMNTVSKVTPVGLQHGTTLSKSQAASNRTQIAQFQTTSGALSNVIGTPGPLQFHIPTSNTTISASTSILPTATQTVTVSTSAIQPLVSTVRTHCTVASSGNKTLYNQQTTDNLQGISSILPHTRPLSSIQDEIRSDEQVPSLLDLLKKKLIEPGENVLMIKHKKQIVVSASLKADGTISPATKLKNFTGGSLSQMLSIVKHKSINWIRNNPSIWKSVFYKGTPLNKLHANYKAFIRSKSSPSQSNVESLTSNIQGTITTTTEMTHTPDPSSSVFLPPSIAIQHMPPSSNRYDLPSSRGHDPFSSRGNDLVTSRSHELSRGHDLVSSMKRVLLISDDELMPVSWGLSSNFLSTDNTKDAFISPEWIEDIDVWT